MTKKILVLGGTRFFGKHLVNRLLADGYEVTLATRGKAEDPFGEQVKRIQFDRFSEASIKEKLSGLTFDLIYDNIAFASRDVANLFEHVTVKKYIVTSSMAVYHRLRLETSEADFDPLAEDYALVTKEDVAYGEGKRSLERILSQKYPMIESVFVRLPYVIGTDDYTKRLHFYVEHALAGTPMFVDNLDNKMSFIDAYEAGEFLAWLGSAEVTGAINGASYGTTTLREVLRLVEKATGKVAMISDDGESAPYNGRETYSLDLRKAKEAGFSFSELADWLPQLLRQLIQDVAV